MGSYGQGNNALLMKKHLLKNFNVLTKIGEGYKVGRSDSLPIAGSFKPKKARMEQVKDGDHMYSKFW